MRKRIVVVGSLNVDLVTTVPRIPQEGETLTGLQFAMHPGGKGANQAVAAARLGGNVRMIGRVGDDPFARTLLGALDAASVDRSLVRTVSGSSGSAVILVEPDGHNSIIVTPGSNNQLLSADLDSESHTLETAGIILAQLEIPLKTVEHLGKLARRFDIPFVLDPAPACDSSRSLLENVTWLTPNETETSILLEKFGHEIGDLQAESEIVKAASLLLEAGAQNVVLKLGKRGCYLAGAEVESCFVPSPQVSAKDTTAAGDAFNGGFAFALMESLPPREAAIFACRVAALSVTKEGAQPSMPTAQEVFEFST